MFEAKILEGNILKKIVEAIKDVVNDVNIDVSPSGKFSDHTNFAILKRLLRKKSTSKLRIAGMQNSVRNKLTICLFYRYFSASNGLIPCSSRLSKFEYGRI